VLRASRSKDLYQTGQSHGGNGGEVEVKEWKCVQVDDHKDVGKTIEEWQKNGWGLHTYQAAGMGAGPMAYRVNHYLLFERGE